MLSLYTYFAVRYCRRASSEDWVW